MLLTALMTACFPPVVLRTINVSADNALHYKVLFCKVLFCKVLLCKVLFCKVLFCKVKRVVFCKVQSSCKVFICRFCTSEVSCEKCCHTSNNKVLFSLSSRKSVAALQTLCSAVLTFIFRTLHTVFGSQWGLTADLQILSHKKMPRKEF